MEVTVTNNSVFTDDDLILMRFADLNVAQKSNDKSSKVGCVLARNHNIVSSGYNSIPRGCDDKKPERHERPEKYKWFHHAELNAVINIGRSSGETTIGCDAYLNWFPCDHCAGVLVNAGIRKIFCDKEPNWNDLKWGEDFKRAKTILDEGGIEIIYMNYEAHRKVNEKN